MAIAKDTTGTAIKQTAGATSATVDITAAATGAWCYFGGNLTANQTGVTFTNWTQVLEGDESTATHFFVFRRQKQAGDTTFTVSWPTSARLVGNWESYTGQNSGTPDELAARTLHTTGTSFPTPSLTPNGAGRWSFTFTWTRDTTSSADLPDGTTWTVDAALTQRTDASNGAAVTSPWASIETADSNGTVTVAAHSYTATCLTAESHGGAVLLFLVPPGAGVAGTVQPRSTVPVPRLRPSRAVVQFTPVRTGQPPRGVLPPWATVPVPRRRLARAVVQFTPVRTPPPPAGTVQPRATVPVPRRRLARAFLPLSPVIGTPPPPAVVSQPPIVPTSGGDRDVELRVFRSIRPGDVPRSGAQLPRLEGRAMILPVPTDTEHAVRAWETPPEPAGPGILDQLAAARDQAAAQAGRAIELGRIFADPPYERHRKTCGNIRKIGGVMLTCKRRPGHAGKHSDRGLDWG